MDYKRWKTVIIKHVGSICWGASFGEGRLSYHRLDGPAVIWLDKNGRVYKTEWWINGIDITLVVRDWIKEMGLPSFCKWNDGHKALYKMAFSRWIDIAAH